MLEPGDERSESAHLSVLKGSLLLDIGQLDEAADVLAKAAELAKIAKVKPMQFTAGLALARLDGMRGNHERACTRLERLGELALTDRDHAARVYEQWRSGGDLEAGQRALAMYRQISARSGDVLSKEREIELGEKLGD